MNYNLNLHVIHKVILARQSDTHTSYLTPHTSYLLYNIKFAH
jgi:hypothetical protein